MRSEIIKYPYLSCVVTHCMYILGNADSSLEPKLIYNDKLMVLNKTHSSAYRHIYDDDGLKITMITLIMMIIMNTTLTVITRNDLSLSKKMNLSHYGGKMK